MPVQTARNQLARRHREVALWVLGLSAGVILASPGTAGEPIRFVRPKSTEKAPLRVDYSSEPAQAKEKRPIGLPQTSSGSGLSQTISVNRKARDARRKWTTPEAEAPDAGTRARMDLQRWRLSQMEEERPAGNAAGAGLFGFGESRESSPGGDVGSPSRAPSDFGLRGSSDSDAGRSPARGSGFSPWGWNSQPAPSANSIRPEAPASSSSLTPAPVPRVEVESPSLRSPGPAIAPYTPRNFDVPGRPR